MGNAKRFRRVENKKIGKCIASIIKTKRNQKCDPDLRLMFRSAHKVLTKTNKLFIIRKGTIHKEALSVSLPNISPLLKEELQVM